MEKNKISTEQTLQLKDATQYLEDLVNCFKSGTIVVEKDGEFLSLTPAEHVNIEISAKTKKGKGKFSMELSWTETEGGALTISDKTPEPQTDAAPAVPEKAGEAPEAAPEKSVASQKKAAPAKAAAPKPAAKKKPASKTAAKNLS